MIYLPQMHMIHWHLLSVVVPRNNQRVSLHLYINDLLCVVWCRSNRDHVAEVVAFGHNPTGKGIWSVDRDLNFDRFWENKNICVTCPFGKNCHCFSFILTSFSFGIAIFSLFWYKIFFLILSSAVPHILLLNFLFWSLAIIKSKVWSLNL